jgi:hypothetical protein
MADKNPITGDLLQSRMNSKEFEDNFDRIFRRKEAFKELQESADQYFAEYELHPSTGEVQKRFVDGVSKPNGEQFGNESDSTES